MSKPFRRKRLSKKQQAKARKAARNLPTNMQDAAFSYADNKHRKGSLGTFGPASEVRHIDPSEYEVEA